MFFKSTTPTQLCQVDLPETGRTRRGHNCTERRQRELPHFAVPVAISCINDLHTIYADEAGVYLRTVDQKHDACYHTRSPHLSVPLHHSRGNKGCSYACNSIRQSRLQLSVELLTNRACFGIISCVVAASGETLTPAEWMHCTKSLGKMARSITPRGGSGRWAAGGHSIRALRSPRHLSRRNGTPGHILGPLAVHSRKVNREER